MPIEHEMPPALDVDLKHDRFASNVLPIRKAVTRELSHFVAHMGLPTVDMPGLAQ